MVVSWCWWVARLLQEPCSWLIPANIKQIPRKTEWDHLMKLRDKWSRFSSDPNNKTNNMSPTGFRFHPEPHRSTYKVSLDRTLNPEPSLKTQPQFEPSGWQQGSFPPVCLNVCVSVSVTYLSFRANQCFQSYVEVFCASGPSGVFDCSPSLMSLTSVHLSVLSFVYLAPCSLPPAPGCLFILV